ncbi:hypothetical protein ISG33_02010 [Glaciecola sp. MH2013]|uniref:hypothetical protein n=1 Tax=Glaciecola sp. MH2013 TaxID=2785524 RepID=UPI00189F286C|nr:hypothetical protein [Glaciecola sp. MH2013]MBF7072176.1 hypothetical protein [Glaciecola sp. MH2013]
MEDKNSNLPTDTGLEKTQSRRKFLTRASSGALLATIPSKSVWATMSSNSIAASGHGSDFAGGKAMHLKKPHHWVDTGVPELTDKYERICGGVPYVGGNFGTCLGSSKNKIQLCHILGDWNEIKSFVKTLFIRKSNGSKIYARVVNKVINGTRYRIKFPKNTSGDYEYFTKNEVLEALAGDHDLNKLIVSAYLNALYSGSHLGIHYPVVNSYNGNRTPFQSAESYIRKIHLSAQGNPSHTREVLNSLHNDPNSFRTV